jgi:hypothetical protein
MSSSIIRPVTEADAAGMLKVHRAAVLQTAAVAYDPDVPCHVGRLA